MMRTTSGAAPARSGISTEAMATPAVPSDHASEIASRHGAEAVAVELLHDDAGHQEKRQPAGCAEIQAPEMPLAGRLSPALETVR